MTRARTELTEAIVRYADRFHTAIGPGHHVASPLGAWLVLALAARAADGERAGELADVLGMDLASAAARADRLLSRPHPLVSAAAAVWHRHEPTAELAQWMAQLPAPVEIGEIPDQAALDDWARRHTDGLIERFPIEVGHSVLVLLASALASRVSWEVPFELAPSAELGPGSEWARRVTTVLRAPADPRHEQFIARTERAGDVAVHAARARDGLLVASVIAAPDVPPSDVLAAAHRLAVELVDGGRPGAVSLFELPLGEGPIWGITEREATTKAADGREERYATWLPAWSADSTHDITGPRELGFPAAAAALAELLGLRHYLFEAKQAAMARYTRIGFEAAAVTALAVRLAAMRGRPGLRREARIRFAHPYAIVAVAAASAWPGSTYSPWHGLPVFSAWVTDPEDASESAAGT